MRSRRRLLLAVAGSLALLGGVSLGARAGAQSSPIGSGALRIQGSSLTLYADADTTDADQTVNVGERARVRTCFGGVDAPCGSVWSRATRASPAWWCGASCVGPGGAAADPARDRPRRHLRPAGVPPGGGLPAGEHPPGGRRERRGAGRAPSPAWRCSTSARSCSPRPPSVPCRSRSCAPAASPSPPRTSRPSTSPSASPSATRSWRSTCRSSTRATARCSRSTSRGSTSTGCPRRRHAVERWQPPQHRALQAGGPTTRATCVPRQRGERGAQPAAVRRHRPARHRLLPQPVLRGQAGGRQRCPGRGRRPAQQTSPAPCGCRRDNVLRVAATDPAVAAGQSRAGGGRRLAGALLFPGEQGGAAWTVEGLVAGHPHAAARRHRRSDAAGARTAARCSSACRRRSRWWTPASTSPSAIRTWCARGRSTRSSSRCQPLAGDAEPDQRRPRRAAPHRGAPRRPAGRPAAPDHPDAGARPSRRPSSTGWSPSWTARWWRPPSSPPRRAGQGTIHLRTGVGELGIPLSPATLVLPRFSERLKTALPRRRRALHAPTPASSASPTAWRWRRRRSPPPGCRG